MEDARQVLAQICNLTDEDDLHINGDEKSKMSKRSRRGSVCFIVDILAPVLSQRCFAVNQRRITLVMKTMKQQHW